MSEFLAREADTGEDLTRLAGWDVDERLPPAVLVIRATELHEPLIGRRARYWMTSLDEDQNIVSIGWRDGLRIISEVEDLVGKLDRAVEPCIWVQEEADYYRRLSGVEHAPRFAAGVSRVWVEQYVTQRPARQPGRGSGDVGVEGGGREDAAIRPNRWLERVVTDAAKPRLSKPIPARGGHTFVGRRVIVVDDEGGFESDLRAVDDPTFTASGDIAITVMSEPDWFQWTERSYSVRHDSMRTIAIENVWIES